MAREFIPYTVYDRYKLFPKVKFRGPAIIEEKESTAIAGEDALVSVDDSGFLWIDLKWNEVEGASRGAGLTVRGKRSRLN